MSTRKSLVASFLALPEIRSRYASLDQLSNGSPASLLALLPAPRRTQILEAMGEQAAERLLHDWQFLARKNQLEPEGAWRNWLLLAGRGFGKTRTGAECVRAWVEAGRYKRIALVGPTAADARDVMIEGESGLMSISPSWFRPHYEPSKRKLSWPNGAVAYTYSADEPERLRGPQHDAAWADELAAWKVRAMRDGGELRSQTWDMLMFGLRLGSDPRCVVTTTPKPTKLILELLKSKTTMITKGSTYENRANLAEAFFTDIITKYEGTRLGRQELLAEVLTDVPGALWRRSMIDDHRVSGHPELLRVVVAIDPSVTAGENSDECGIVVAARGYDGHAYVLEDCTCLASPLDWAHRAVNAYRQHRADLVTAEVNNGGDLVVTVLGTVCPTLPYRAVHATRGKITRAEPVAAMYEQGRVHHCGDPANFEKIEEELVTYVPGNRSPNRMDALVYAITELFLEPAPPSFVIYDQPVRISPY